MKREKIHRRKWFLPEVKCIIVLQYSNTKKRFTELFRDILLFRGDVFRGEGSCCGGEGGGGCQLGKQKIKIYGEK